MLLGYGSEVPEGQERSELDAYIEQESKPYYEEADMFYDPDQDIYFPDCEYDDSYIDSEPF
jgi:hypothetical protein